MFSIASENSFPISAKEVTASASMPANGPMPTQKTKMTTYSRASIERRRFSMARAAKYNQMNSGLRPVRFLAARKLNGKASAAPMVVANMAWKIVTNICWSTTWNTFGERSTLTKSSKMPAEVLARVQQAADA